MSSKSNNNQNGVKDAIKAYLDKRAQEDTLFAVSYAKTNKSIDECFDYIHYPYPLFQNPTKDGVKNVWQDKQKKNV